MVEPRFHRRILYPKKNQPCFLISHLLLFHRPTSTGYRVVTWTHALSGIVTSFLARKKIHPTTTSIIGKEITQLTTMSNPFPQVWVHYLHGDSTLLCLSRANLNHQQPGLNPHEAHDTICHKPKMRLPLQQTNWPVEKGFFGVLKPVRSSCSSNFGWFNQKKLVSTTIHLIKSYIYY